MMQVYAMGLCAPWDTGFHFYRNYAALNSAWEVPEREGPHWTSRQSSDKHHWDRVAIILKEASCVVVGIYVQPKPK